MAKELRLDLENTNPFIDAVELAALAGPVKQAHEALHNRSGAGSEYLGWLDLPLKFQATDLAAINEAALRIKEKAEAFVVIGIGGSYLGSRATVELLNHSFNNQLEFEHRGFPQIYYLGHTISPTYTAELLEILAGKNFMVNVISKSGTTTEPAIAFRLVRELLIKKYGSEQNP